MTEFESAKGYIRQCEKEIADSVQNLEERLRGTGICIEYVRVSAAYNADSRLQRCDRKFVVLGVDVGTSFLPKSS